ncbi:dynamin family protein [Pasteurella atlantica]|uniref:Dynamin family protein n=2 Tax=Pasteurellaceae TaxID=712 RepID=A0ACC6HJD4_9PAST|nr:dynamin family protein [Pasteurella atlantica]MDP8050995.1 dynamin family protein [Pasteurella atlantica]MDP8104291.1 dynamin family protein [Pasteurella atlantica]MDP8147651.1 dynamin family protein [Pasteurella atlantica]
MKNLQNTKKLIEEQKEQLAQISLREKLISHLLNAKQENKFVYQYFETLSNDFLPFVTSQGQLETFQTLKSIGEKLIIIASNPSFHQKTVVAIAGGFSAGKSAFINSLIEDKSIRLPTDINPTTAIPTYILNGENSLKALSSKGGIVELDKIDPNFHFKLSHQFISQFEINLKSIMPQIFLSTPINYEHLCFIDTPGYDPAVMQSCFTEKDREIAENYVSQSDALIWIIGLDANGTIPKTDLDFLSNITSEIKSIYVVLNKADIRPKSAVEEVLRVIKDTLDDYAIDIAGICGYSSLDSEEVCYQGMSLFEFLKKQNKISEKHHCTIDKLYEIKKICHKSILDEINRRKQLKKDLERLGISSVNINLNSDSPVKTNNIQELIDIKKPKIALKKLDILILKLEHAINGCYGIDNKNIQHKYKTLLKNIFKLSFIVFSIKKILNLT